MPVETPLTPIAHLKGRTDANGYLSVNLAAGSVTISGADGALLDGVDPLIKATVKDYTNSNPLAVIVVDTSGDPVAGTGGGPATIADGADVTQGAIADVAVVGDNSGTLSAKARGLNKRIALNTDTGNNRFYVDGSGVTQPVSIATAPVLVAGSAIIGKVGIDQTTPGTTNAVAIISGQNGVAGGTGVDAATVQRVSLATNIALPAGTNVIGHVIADTGSTTAVTGDVTVVQGTGTNLHTVIDSGTLTTVSTVTAVTAISNALPAGTNAIGKLAANSGVDIGDIDVTSVIAGTGATNLGKAEDAAHTTGDTGVFSLAVSNENLTAFGAASGDYAPEAVNRYGQRYVTAPPPSRISSNVTPVTATVTTAIAAPSASTHLRVVRFQFSNGGSTAAIVGIRDGAAGTVYYPTYLVQGAAISLNLGLSGPLDLTTATRLDIYLSAAGSINYTIDYFTVAD